jgi:hypothetical protein
MFAWLASQRVPATALSGPAVSGRLVDIGQGSLQGAKYVPCWLRWEAEAPRCHCRPGMMPPVARNRHIEMSACRPI